MGDAWRPESRVTGCGGKRGRGWQGDCGWLVWVWGRGRLRPVEPLSGLSDTHRRVAGPGGDPSGRGHSRCPIACPAGQGVVGIGVVSPGMEGPSDRGTGREGGPRETSAPREPTPARPPPRAGHLNGDLSPRDVGPGCHPRRGRPFTPRQGPNNVRTREVGGARGRLRWGPWDARGMSRTHSFQDLPSGPRILSRAAAAAALAGRGPARAAPPATTRRSMLRAQPHAPPAAPHRSAHRPASLRPPPDPAGFSERTGFWGEKAAHGPRLPELQRQS